MVKKVTALKVQKRNRERVNVYLDGEFAFGLARITAAWLYVGQELDDAKITQLIAEDARETAYQKALRFLNYRERSEAEIRKYLVGRAVPLEIIEDTIKRLHQSGLLDNRRFVKNWVANRSEFRPRGRRALAYELRQKGIAAEEIHAALDDLDEEELAMRAARKQARKYKNLVFPEFRRKMYGFLSRRGFNYDTSSAVIHRIWEEVYDNNKREEDEVEQ